jgi:hypothetical protein
MSSLRTLAALTVALALALPATASATTSGSFDDPIGDSTQYAPDLGATTVTIGDDDTIVVDTRIVPRPEMSVTWYFDYSSSSGSDADGGADAKVVATPSQGRALWESGRWDAATGNFSVAARPTGAEYGGGATWTLSLGDLGISRPATLRVWVVAELRDSSDTAGPGTVVLSEPPSAGGVVEGGQGCTTAIGKTNALQRKIRKVMRKRGRAAHRRVVGLRARRTRALMVAEQRCGAEVGSGSSPRSAPPGCHLVTMPVLRQDGMGAYAPWALRSEAVVDCRQR